MIRVLVDPGAADGPEIDLPEAELHHLRVRRVEAGERVEVLDGQGTVVEAVLRVEGRHVALEVVSREKKPPVAGTAALLAVGDKERFVWAVEKLTELGVSDVFPCLCERSASVASQVREKHLPGLRRRARDTIKQCGAPYAPTIHSIGPFASVLDRLPDGERWVAHAGGGPPPRTIELDRVVTVAVGPEGGYTEEERGALGRSGFLTVGLGSNVLRFETAAVAIAAAVVIARGGRA